VQLVAKLHDTSASQIEKHYAATIASHTPHRHLISRNSASPTMPGTLISDWSI
jgi:hypothetical protein